MQKQIWVFLTAEDERALLDRLVSDHGARLLGGRWFKGSDEELRERPETLETRELRANERWTVLLHPEATRGIVAHETDEGPFAGWRRLDEVRSEVLCLVHAQADSHGLGPSRLVASTHAWFRGEKLRKSHEFTRWTSACMALVEQLCPPTSFDWLRIASGAQAWARDGGRLHYLHKEVALLPEGTVPTRPHKRKLGVI